MFKTLKFLFYITLICLILSPFFISSSGISPSAYVQEFGVENGSFLEIDGYETYYIDFNSESEKTILFLHGFGGSAINWLPVMKSFGDEYRLVAVDLKGFGFSEKSLEQNYSHPSQTKFLKSFVQKLELENITLVGHSMGGNIATMYVQEYPDDIEKLVLISGALQHEREVDVFRINALKFLDYPVLREYVRIFFKLAMTENRVEEVFKSAVYKQEGFEISEEFFVNPTLFLNWEYVLIKVGASSHLNTLENDFKEIQTPVLLIWGAEDPWIPLSKGQYLNGVFLESELKILESVGHLPMIEDPENTIKILKENL